jgi:fucose permease
MPFLRSELNLSYTLGGLHLTFFSAGMILTGLFGSGFAHFWGRGPVLWGGAVGIANLFPFAMTLAVGSAPRQSDLASARIALAVGLAVISAPLSLGWLADHVDIQNAYLIIALFLLSSLILPFTLRRAASSPY